MTKNNYFLAIAKMLDEMSNASDSQLHTIHNWLCDQEDDNELMEGILKENRSIAGSMEYCAEKARKQAQSGARFAMVDDLTVFRWVREYFIVDETPKEKRERELKSSQLEKKKKTSEKKEASLDKFLENEGISPDSDKSLENTEGAIQLELFGDF